VCGRSTRRCRWQRGKGGGFEGDQREEVRGLEETTAPTKGWGNMGGDLGNPKRGGEGGGGKREKDIKDAGGNGAERSSEL